MTGDVNRPGNYVKDDSGAVMLTYSLEQGVLVFRVLADPGVSGRAHLLARMGDLVRGHRPAPVVVVLDDTAVGGVVISVVLRAHRMCTDLGVFMSVVTHSAAARRLLEAAALTSGVHLVVHARADTAVATAFTAAA